MQDIDLFPLALALTPPWRVVDSQFEGEQKRLELRIDVAAGSRFDGPGCGRAGCGGHDTEQKSWRHWNVFQHAASLQARVPRVTCLDCGR